MDGQPDRYQIDDTDYDDGKQRRWYYSLYCDRDKQWFWEPRMPTPAELAAPHALGCVSWKPTTVIEAEWPALASRGPYVRRGRAIEAAEEWFGSRL